jgi:hypothetical protein
VKHPLLRRSPLSLHPARGIFIADDPRSPAQIAKAINDDVETGLSVVSSHAGCLDGGLSWRDLLALAARRRIVDKVLGAKPAIYQSTSSNSVVSEHQTAKRSGRQSPDAAARRRGDQ